MLRKIDIDFLEELELSKADKLSEEDKEKIITEVNRRVRRKLIMQVTVAAIALVFLCGGLLHYTGGPGTADQGNIANEMVYDENSGISSRNNEGAGLSYLTYTESDIEDFKKQYKQLLLPANIPEEFNFISLTTTINKYQFSAEYKYDYKGSEFLITQTEHFIDYDVRHISSVVEEIDLSFGKVYVQRSEIAGYYGVLIYYDDNYNCNLELRGKISEIDELSIDVLLFILEGMLDDLQG